MTFIAVSNSIRTYRVVARCPPEQVYHHPERYLDFFQGDTVGQRRFQLVTWCYEMKQRRTWVDQLFINAIARAHMINIRIMVREGEDMLRDEQGNYAGQGTATNTTYYMLHSGGSHFEALRVVQDLKPFLWTQAVSA